MARKKTSESGELTTFGDVLLPTEALEPILGKHVRAALLEWLTEIWAKDELEAMKVAPRKRAMFDGPPGVGKTTLAHHLAARLGLRMLAVRPDRIISSYLGSTGKNLGALFDALLEEEEREPVILFLDEFDAIAIKRKQTDEAAGDEQNAWVNTLLQRIEQHPGFIIAATNHGDRVDPAVWRRFDIQITLELPGQFERERILQRYLDPLGLPTAELSEFAESLETASPALIRQLCENIKRQLIVGPKVAWDMRREAVFDRLLASFGPHPDLGKPRLWSKGSADLAVRQMTWPPPLAADVVEAKPVPAAAENTVVAFPGGRS